MHMFIISCVFWYKLSMIGFKILQNKKKREILLCCVSKVCA